MRDSITGIRVNSYRKWKIYTMMNSKMCSEEDLFNAVTNSDFKCFLRLQSSHAEIEADLRLTSEVLPPETQKHSLLEICVRYRFLPGVNLLLQNSEVSLKTLKEATEVAVWLSAEEFYPVLLTVIENHQDHKDTSWSLGELFCYGMFRGCYNFVSQLMKLSRFDHNIEATWGLDRPLHIVVNHQQVALVEQLLLANVIIDVGDRGGVTPLMKACLLDCSPVSYEIISILLHHGADPNHKVAVDALTRSPLQSLYSVPENINNDAAHQVALLMIRAGLDIDREFWVAYKKPLKSLWTSVLRPMSLSMLCFIAIRNHCRLVTQGTSILHVIQALDLPSKVRHFLAMEDLKNVNSSL